MMKLYYNPVSSYSQKVIMAFYEKGVEFIPVVINLMDPAARADYLQINPWGKVPTLATDDGGRVFPESSIIIEYIDNLFPEGVRLIPSDLKLALKVRLYDRLCDCYLNDPMQVIFFDSLKPPAERNPVGVAKARATLDATYAFLEKYFAGQHWIAGEMFSVADCAAAPSLNYLRTVYPFDNYTHLIGYAERLTERPSFVRAFEEAKPLLARLKAIR